MELRQHQPPVRQSGQTELAIKDVSTTIDSRSGHSTVMSEDGNYLIVLGGWVGDMTQSASPQLAVIEIGASLGEWQWSVPTAQPPGPGIYGHGAVLLPGKRHDGFGGHRISASSSKHRRQVGGDGEMQMFFNITTQTWSNDVHKPSGQRHNQLVTRHGKRRAAEEPPDRTGHWPRPRDFSRLIVVAVGALCYRRRARHKRYQRESDLRRPRPGCQPAFLRLRFRPSWSRG